MMKAEDIKTTIHEQLKDRCNCMGDIRDEDIDELINLISMWTCWTNKPCETFLPEEREEVIELPNCMCDCDVFEFSPFYHPFDDYLDSFTFTLIKQKGIEEEAVPIEDYAYSVVDKVFRIKLPLPDCKCMGNCDCGCETNYKLLVTYIAGYATLPECLIPIFCEALQWVQEKNDCDCDDCQDCHDTSTEYQIDYENSNSLVDRLADFFMVMLTKQYKKELALISLCQDNFFTEGFVV